MRRTFLYRYRYHFLLFVLLTAAYHFVFNPSFVEERIRSYIENNTGAKISLKVKRSSLFYGFDFRDIRLAVKENDVPILEADRIELSWFLPSILAGHIGLRELGLYNVKVHILQKDGRWNTAALRNPNRSEDESDRETPEPDRKRSELPDRINVLLPLKVYGAVLIQNSSFYYEEEPAAVNRNRPKKLHLENLNTRVGFVTTTFNSIPLDQTAVELFETLVIAVNPFQPLLVNYTDNGTLEGPVDVKLRLYRRVDDEGTSFSSRLDFDSGKLAYRNPYAYAPPPALKLSYDTYYQHTEDLLRFNKFNLSYGNDTWLALNGEILRILEGPQEVDVHVTESNINLTPPGQFISVLSGNRLRFGGVASLFPLKAEGTPENLYLEGKLKGRNLYFATAGRNHNVPVIDFRIAGRVNLYENVAFLKPPPDYIPDSGLAFGVVKVLLIDELNAQYNGARLSGLASILPGKGIDAAIQLQNFNLGLLLAPMVTGFGSADLKAESDLSFEEVSIQGNVNVTGGRYAIGRSRSGINNLNLDTDVLLKLKDGFALDIRSASLRGTNAAGGPFLKLDGSSVMDFREGQSYTINISDLDISYNDAFQTLPGAIRARIVPFRVYLQKGIKASTNSTVRVSDGSTAVQGNSTLTLPSLGNEPIQVANNLIISKNQISFPNVTLAGLRGALSAGINGRLYKTDKWKPDLKVNLNIARETMLPVHENISLKGSLKLNADVSPEYAVGGLYIQNLGVRYYTGNCMQPDSPQCKTISVEGLNLELPVRHNMNMTSPVVVGSLNVRKSSGGFRSEPNLSLKYVRSSHRPDGNYAPDGFYFVGAVPANLPQGLAGRVDYKNNVLQIDWLDSYAAAPVRKEDGLVWEPRGRISGRNLFFNIADLDPANMEFGAFLQAHNLDLSPYFGSGEQAAYDGVISADAKAYGKDLRDVLRTTNARIAVHRISDDFTGFAVRLFLPNPILASGVNNILEIPSLSAELRGGLVYTSIQVKSPGPFSLARVIRPSEEEIKQERIPLAQFLERARAEADAFQPGAESE